MSNLTECPESETTTKGTLFHSKTREKIQSFPEEVRRKLGKAIFDLQKGAKLSLPISKPITSIGVGVEELRIKDRYGAYRIFYYTKHETLILIFHAFMKKTQKTPKSEIDLGIKNLKEMLNEKK